MTSLALNGDFAGARKLHYQLLPFVKAAFIETNPVPIKRALTLSGLPGGPTRLPLGPMSPDNEKILTQEMAALKTIFK
jgi:4-hydroxy-tetrahydrodipicolinate synthase